MRDIHSKIKIDIPADKSPMLMALKTGADPKVVRRVGGLLPLAYGQQYMWRLFWRLRN